MFIYNIIDHSGRWKTAKSQGNKTADWRSCTLRDKQYWGHTTFSTKLKEETTEQSRRGNAQNIFQSY